MSDQAKELRAAETILRGLLQTIQTLAGTATPRTWVRETAACWPSLRRGERDLIRASFRQCMKLTGASDMRGTLRGLVVVLSELAEILNHASQDEDEPANDTRRGRGEA